MKFSEDGPGDGLADIGLDDELKVKSNTASEVTNNTESKAHVKRWVRKLSVLTSGLL